MFAYAPVALRPVRLAPRFGVLGQQGSLPTGPAPRPPILPPMAKIAVLDTISSLAGQGMLYGAGMLLVTGGTAWVGIHTGIKEKGVLSFTGWTVGILAGLGGVLTLTAIAGLGVIKSAASNAASNVTSAAAGPNSI